MKKLFALVVVAVMVAVFPVVLGGCTNRTIGDGWVEVQNVSWNGTTLRSTYQIELSNRLTGYEIYRDYGLIPDAEIIWNIFPLEGYILTSRLLPEYHHSHSLSIGETVYFGRRFGAHAEYVYRATFLGVTKNIVEVRTVSQGHIEIRHMGVVQTIMASNIQIVYFV